MKNRIATMLVLLFATFVNAQNDIENSAVKLFVDQNDVIAQDSTYAKDLDLKHLERLYRKTAQLINQVGITEIGYSNFLVSPKFDIISITEDKAGTTKVVLAECELLLTIKRVVTDQAQEVSGTATFATFSKKIMGSGFSKEEAITNAIGSLTPSDEKIRNFFIESKSKISNYYNTHCEEIMRDADQALAMKNYLKSISLNFSVPSTAPCYAKAYASAQKVYTTYIEDECEKQLTLMKTYAALAKNKNENAEKYYLLIVGLIRNIRPSAEKCYAAAKSIIEKIEKDLSEQQQQDWELTKKTTTDYVELEKERYKALQAISNSYVPAPAVIITK